MFETTGVIDEELLKEIKIHMLGKKQRIFFAIALLFFIVMAVVNYFQKDFTTMFIYLGGVALIILEVVLVMNKGVTTTVTRMIEVSGRPESRYTTRFDEDGIYMHNHDTNGEGTIKYETIAKFVETKRAYFLFTEARQYVVSFKNGKFEKDELVNFLKQKPTQIKWK